MTIEIKGKEVVLRTTFGQRHRRSLLSGFTCPECGEVLKAYFTTHDPIDLGLKPDAWDAPFKPVTVPGGQAVFSNTHGEYGRKCGIEVFWAPSLKHSLIEWLEKKHGYRRVRNIEKALLIVRDGRIEGLVAIPDVVNPDAFLLGFIKDKWVRPWDSIHERYEEYQKREEQETEEKLRRLGVALET